MNKYAVILLALLVLMACNQEAKDQDDLIEVELLPFSPGDQGSLRWSPKGEQLPLTATELGLVAELHLGPADANPIGLRLSKSPESPEYDLLTIDMDRDGLFGSDQDEIWTCTPNERRGKMWSSFSGSVNIPFPKDKKEGAVSNSYPLSLWYVFDPLEPDQEPVIRFSRRGWMEGEAESEFGKIRLLLTESEMNGRYDRGDSWAISHDTSRQLLFHSKSAKNTDSHNWLGDQAFGIDSLLPSGRKVWIKAIDPQITRAEEEAQNDWLAPDRAAKRSGERVVFLHDYEEAVKLAKKNHQALLIDFETTWCGPCKTMDQWVYTADLVIAACQNLVCVKVDGDERRDLVKKHKIDIGYPTVILIGSDGKELKRATGYQSVAHMIEFVKIQ